MNSTTAGRKIDRIDLVTRDCEVFDRYVKAAGKKPKEFKGSTAKFRDYVKDRVAEVLLGPDEDSNVIFDTINFDGKELAVLEYIRRYMEYLIYNGTLEDLRGNLTRTDRIYLEDINLFQVGRYLKDLKGGHSRLVAQLEREELDVNQVISKLEQELKSQS